jgi:hypothetical protein
MKKGKSFGEYIYTLSDLRESNVEAIKSFVYENLAKP